MPKGGRRTRSGRVPDMSALVRQVDAKTFTRLPRECNADIPGWPQYMSDPSVDEEAMWDELWRRPQAYVWHVNSMFESVAIYVRQFCDASGHDASAVKLANVRQLADTILLTPGSLTRERYVITGSTEDEILTKSTAHASTGTDGQGARGPATRSSAKSRFQVVPFPNATEVRGDEASDENDDPDA